MKRFIFIIIFFSFQLIIYARQAKSNNDSLEYVLHQKTGIEKAAILNALAENYWKTNSETSFLYANEAKSIAIDFADSTALADAYHNIGRYHYINGEHKKSLESYFNSLRISEAIEYLKGIGKAYNSLGLSYMELKNIDEAVKYFNRSQEYFRKINDIDLLSSAVNNLGIVFIEKGDYVNGLKQFEESYKLVLQTQNYQKISARLNNIGYVYGLMSDYSKALLYYNYSYRIADSLNSAYDKANILINTGSIYYKLNNTKKAIAILEEALNAATQIQAKPLIQETSELLSEIYLDLNNYKKAYSYLLINTTIKDSIFNETKNKQILEIQARYENEKNKNENKLLQHEKEIAKLKIKKQRHFNYFVIAAIFLITAILFIILKEYKTKNKINEILEVRNKEIYRQNKEIKNRTEDLQKANYELNKLSEVASKTNNAVIIMDTNYDIEYINQGFTRMFGFTLEELYNVRGKNLLELSANKNIYQQLKKVLFEKETTIYEAENLKKNGEKIWVQTTITPIIDADGNVNKLIAIDSDISQQKKAENEIRYQRDEIALQKKEITDSIIYSKRIQNAILTSRENIKHIIPDSFTIYIPKEIIGGDFYWMRKIKNEVIVAVADCTGHGVPGALMSMLGITLFNEVVEKKEITTPGEILNEIRSEIIRILHQTDDEGSNDGMDIAICAIDIKTRILKYAGANNPLIIANKNRILELKPDKMPVSLYYRKEKPFFTQEVELTEKDMIYMYTDGFVDQFGGKEGKKFFKSSLFKLIKEISNKEPIEQKTIFEKTFTSWKGEEAQLDDVTLVGFRLPS